MDKPVLSVVLDKKYFVKHLQMCILLGGTTWMYLLSYLTTQDLIY